MQKILRKKRGKNGILGHTVSLMIFISKFQFTCDLHGVANQENNIYCDFHWKGNYSAFFGENSISCSITTNFVNRLKLTQDESTRLL